MGDREDRRRRYRRIPLHLSAIVDADGRCGKGRVRNLSREGIFVCIEHLPKPGEKVRVVFETLQHRKIDLLGTVRWTTDQLGDEKLPKGFGMIIDDPGPDYADFFEDLARRGRRVTNGGPGHRSRSG